MRPYTASEALARIPADKTLRSRKAMIDGRIKIRCLRCTAANLPHWRTCNGCRRRFIKRPVPPPVRPDQLVRLYQQRAVANEKFIDYQRHVLRTAKLLNKWGERIRVLDLRIGTALAEREGAIKRAEAAQAAGKTRKIVIEETTHG